MSTLKTMVTGNGIAQYGGVCWSASVERCTLPTLELLGLAEDQQGPGTDTPITPAEPWVSTEVAGKPIDFLVAWGCQLTLASHILPRPWLWVLTELLCHAPLREHPSPIPSWSSPGAHPIAATRHAVHTAGLPHPVRRAGPAALTPPGLGLRPVRRTVAPPSPQVEPWLCRSHSP